MKKRGSVIVGEVLLWILEFLLIGITFASMVNFVMVVHKDTIFERNQLSKDISMVINALHSSPNQIWISYPNNIDVDKFNFEFYRGLVSVMDNATEDNKNPIPLSYRYPMSTSVFLRSIKGENRIKDYKKLEFLFNGNEIIIDKDLSLRRYHLCNEYAHTGLGIREIFIDPGHDNSDKGFNDNEHEITLRYAQAIKNQLTLLRDDERVNFELTRETGRSIDRSDIVSELNRNQDEFLISLHLGKYNPSKNYIKAFISERREPLFKLMICNILKRVQEKNNYDSSIIIEIDPDEVYSNSHDILLLNENSAIIEIGNIDSSRRLISEIEFASIIKEVLLEFK
jgi:N-acetylmuramoyl-L-alanine amidase